MKKQVRHVVIVGGGAAGWLTAGVIAADHHANREDGLKVTLIESPDVPAIGVGEGTWPTMRETLDKIGVSETDLVTQCDASFKQGAKFCRWVTGEKDDYYYHPLVIPNGYLDTDLVSAWQPHADKISFDNAVCYQGHLCDRNLAPKQIATPEFAAVANYAYHINAPKLGLFLRDHCVKNLGVHHILDHVQAVENDEQGYIRALQTANHGELCGDFYVDCSGLRSMLIGKHFQIPFIEQSHILFNDRAIAAQVPYLTEDEAIASQTNSTALSNGWVWDIALSTRRGMGYTWSSQHSSEEAAEIEFQTFLKESLPTDLVDSLDYRHIQFNPGHREKFWHKNCVAIGMSAGFLEPLEASALVMIELAAAQISLNMPASREVMPISAERYNALFRHRWKRIIEFLKLHYVLSKRKDSAYWRDNKKPQSIPENLQQLLTLWRYQPPGPHDFTHINEVFPSASWQYILYGMGFRTETRASSHRFADTELAHRFFRETESQVNQYIQQLPTNRELIDKIKQYGLQKV